MMINYWHKKWLNELVAEKFGSWWFNWWRMWNSCRSSWCVHKWKSICKFFFSKRNKVMLKKQFWKYWIVIDNDNNKNKKKKKIIHWKQLQEVEGNMRNETVQEEDNCRVHFGAVTKCSDNLIYVSEDFCKLVKESSEESSDATYIVEVSSYASIYNYLVFSITKGVAPSPN